MGLGLAQMMSLRRYQPASWSAKAKRQGVPQRSFGFRYGVVEYPHAAPPRSLSEWSFDGCHSELLSELRPNLRTHNRPSRDDERSTERQAPQLAQCKHSPSGCEED